MKLSLVLILLCLIIACQSKPNPIQKPEIATKEDSLELIIQKKLEVCHILTSRQFGESFLKDGIKLKDLNTCDSLMLSVVDTLPNAPQNEQLFWFSVLSKMSNQTDGYLSEGFGNMAYNFVEKQPLQFAKNILGVKKDFQIETNLKNWADQIYGEISIANEGDEKKAVEIYIKNLKKAAKNFEMSELKIIDRFCKILIAKF